MNLFEQLVDQALSHNTELTQLRMVVEKELLHHDILLAMSDSGLLQQLCFIGGTCLRACYGSNRLSEDLDFTGGAHFKRESLAELKTVLTDRLQKKYGLSVEVSEPQKETGNVDTWKLRIQTRPERKDLPAQRINIDICAIPSYLSQPRVLLNPYGVDMGTQGLILNAQALEEIYADKILAFALRHGRIKNRDLWDLLWLKQQGIKPAFELLLNKLRDHQQSKEVFLSLANNRAQQVATEDHVKQDFRNEMQRFLPTKIVAETVNNDRFWEYLSNETLQLIRQVEQFFLGKSTSNGFLM
ncbi:MAG TPA: nucleotidyl transferase AbiEii/AbiGii toxin family protein [Thiopseudomonas sp.]|nr:nucleotidyl transferase AbiEii/AbiGii toxin family protein [Thiopseudomonas sp.]